MKIKKNLMLLTIILISIGLFSFSNRVNAATISDDGKYYLILSVCWDNEDIDGEYAKIIRFNVEDGETKVKLSELTEGIVPFNGENQFSHWGKNFSDDEKADEELAIADFNHSGEFNGVSYTNGLVLWAKFSNEPLQGTGKYYLTLDPFAGTINGKANLRLISQSTEFKTVDLTKYIPVREGCTFKGWDLNGKFVTSIDSSAFANTDAVNVTATYTQDTFVGDGIVVVLNANGGTIDGKSSNKYDYLGGGNSGTSMSLLPYIPVREGYSFNGWNTKSDGSGENYTYIYWRLWDKDNTWDSTVERDTLIQEDSGYERYKNLTLYATWTKNPETPTTPDEPTKPTEDTVKEIQSTGEIKTNIQFTNGISKDYKLDVEKIGIKKELLDKNVKFIVDMNVLDGNDVVKISDNKMKIRIAMPEDLKGYNKYEVVYILNDEIKERIPATVENGYIVFETSHLSQYGIVATNVEKEPEKINNETNNSKTTDNIRTSKTVGTNVKEKSKKTKNETKNPKTADNIMTSIMLFVTSITAIGALTVVNRKKLKK